MTAHPHVQRIRDAYGALTVGDLSAGLKNLAPQAVLHIKGSGPLSGDHTGVDDISRALTGLFELTAGTLTLDVASVFAGDHHAVVVLRESASRPDGATLDDEGRITDLWDLPDDPDAHERFFDGD